MHGMLTMASLVIRGLSRCVNRLMMMPCWVGSMVWSHSVHGRAVDLHCGLPQRSEVKSDSQRFGFSSLGLPYGRNAHDRDKSVDKAFS